MPITWEDAMKKQKAQTTTSGSSRNGGAKSGMLSWDDVKADYDRYGSASEYKTAKKAERDFSTRVDELNSRVKNLYNSWNAESRNTNWRSADETSQFRFDYEAERESIFSLIDELQNEYRDNYEFVNSLKEMTSELRKPIDFDQYESYWAQWDSAEAYADAFKYDVADNADFGENSQYVSTKSDGIMSKLFSQYNMGYDDLAYEYINNQDIRDEINAKARTFGSDNGKTTSPFAEKHYDFMTDGEVSTYNYLYHTEGKKSAQEYLDHLQLDLDARAMNEDITNAAQFAEKHPVASSVATVPANLLSGVGMIDAAGQYAINKAKSAITGEEAAPINYNSEAMALSNMSTAVRGTVAQNIADATGYINLDETKHPVLSKIFNGKNLGEVYQMGMSMADSTAVAALTAMGIPNAQILLAGSAATQSVLDAASRGATDEQALFMGVLNGAAEYFFEKYEIESIISNASDGVLKGIFKSMLSEGVGEGATTIANTLADTFVMASKSEWQTNINEYMAQGLSLKEARKQAFLDSVIQVGWDAIGGAAMGGVMGGGASITHNIMDKVLHKAQPGEQNAPVQTEQTAFNDDAPEVLVVDDENAEDAAYFEAVREMTEQKALPDEHTESDETTHSTDASKPIRLYRGFNKSNNASEKNLTQRKNVFDYIGHQNPDKELDLVPLSYYTESEEDARSYSDMDLKYLERYRDIATRDYRRKVIEGQDMSGISEDEYAESEALKTFQLMHGGDPNNNGYVEAYDYTPGKVLDLTPMGDVTNPDLAYKVLSDAFGISENELDDIITLGNVFEDEFRSFQLLRNTPGSNLGTKIVELARNAGFDSFKYEEDGYNHYALINDANDSKPRVATIKQNATGALETASKKYGAQAGAMIHTYKPGQDVAKYDQAYSLAYEMGKEGVKLEYAKSRPTVAYLSEKQIELAYGAGADSVVVNNKEVTHNEGEEVHLRNGVQRNDGQSAGGQVRSMGEGTGRLQNRSEEAAGRSGVGRTVDGEVREKVSSRDLGLPNGTAEKNIRLYSGKETSEIKQAKAVAKEHGMEIVLFEGGNLTAMDNDGSTFEARAFVNGNKMFIRADHKKFSAAQLARHEAGHNQVSKGEVDVNSVYDRLVDMYGEETVMWVMEQYAVAYSMSGMTVDQVFEEIMCDSLADMNAFDGETGAFMEYYMKETKAQANADIEMRKARGPPSDISDSVPSDIKYSLANDAEFMDNADKRNQTGGFVSGKTMESARKAREAVRAIMTNPDLQEALGLPEDISGNTFFSDASYGGTEENTTICPRSMGAEALLDAVSDLIGRPLTVDEQIVISQEMQGLTANPECVYCYVATDRKAYREFLGEYLKQRDDVLKAYKAGNTDTSRNGSLYQDFLNGRKDTNNMYKRFSMWIKAYSNGSAMLKASDLTSMNRLVAMQSEKFSSVKDSLLRQQYVDAMKYAQAASWAKKRVNYIAYNGHILNWKQKRINDLNSHYGLRMYSFSDFSPAFILENMQMITDASVRGLKVLGYTKDLNFVKIFAKTGMNINLSCFGFEVGGNVYENAFQGAAWEQAKELREQNPNVGVVFVATNDTLVEWALDQNWIDVVIPYHLVRTGTKVAEAFGFTNYTSISGDQKITGEWVKGKDIASVPPTLHNNDKQQYMAALEANHLKPRFEKWIEHPGYMKLVNETRRSAADTPSVQPVFNVDAAKSALNDMMREGGYYQPIGGTVDRMWEIAQEMADNINKSVRFSRETTDAHKERQLEIVLESNPVHDDIHTWIRNVDDIKTYAEALDEEGYEEDDDLTPDFTGKMVSKAVNTGSVTVYSSYPIKQGVFVTPSKMEAQSYAGKGKVYSKNVKLTDVAWIDPLQGQYAKVDGEVRFSREAIDSIGRVLSKEQQEFFKDSKVRDDDGKLLSVFHGTKDGNFTVFQYDPNRQTGTDFGEAYYFTNNYENAKGYAKDNGKDARVQEYFDAKNKLKQQLLAEEDPAKRVELRKKHKEFKLNGMSLNDILADTSYETGGEVKEMYLNLTNPLIVDANGGNYYKLYPKYFADAKQNGNDGIIVKNVEDKANTKVGTSDVYIAFKPEQIKNIDNRKPTSDPDIRFSREMSDTDREVIRNLEKVQMRARVGYWRTAAYTDERIEREIQHSSASDIPDYAKSFITWMSPREFIGATTEGDKHRQLIKSESRPLDSERLRSTEQPIYLMVDFESGRVVGHEGRHRMTALADAGIDKVAVIIDARGHNRHNVQPIESKWVDGQKLQRSSGYGFFLHDLLPLSERYADDARRLFTDEKSKVRFSRENPTYAELTRLNKAQKERIEALKGELKRTKVKSVRLGDVDKVAKSILEEYQSQADFGTTRNAMKDLADYIVRDGDGQNELTWDTVKAKAVAIAQDIVNKAQVMTNETELETFKEIKAYLRNNPIALENKADIADFNDFRKRNFGRFKISKTGTPMDTMWLWLQGEFGKGFFPEDITHPADQIQHIEWLLTSMAPEYANPYKGEIAENVEACAHVILGTLLSDAVRQTPPTFADKQANKLLLEKSKLIEKHNAKIEKLEDKHMREMDAAVAKSLEKIKKLQQEKADIKAHYKEARKQATADRKESADVKKYRARIEAKTKKLSDMLLKNSDKEHIPEVLKTVIGDYLQSIDFSSKSLINKGVQTKKDMSYTVTLDRVRQVLQNQLDYMGDPEKGNDNGFYLDMPAGFAQAIQEHINTVNSAATGLDATTNQVYMMNAAELADVDYILTVILHSVSQVNELMANAHFHSVVEASKTTIDDLKNLGEAVATGKVANFLQWDNATPYYAFKRLGAAPMSIFEGIQDGWDKMALNVRAVKEYAEAAYTADEAKSWNEKLHDITLDSGETIRMSVPQIMSLHCLTKREQAMKHLMGGGIRVGDIELQGKQPISKAENYALTTNDLTIITSLLSDRQLAVADKLQQYMNTVGTDWGNEVSMRRFGYRSFTESNYFPIQSDSTNLPAVHPDAQANDLFRLLNMSMTKGLNPNANNALVVSNIFDVFADHMSDMAKYNALALPVLDAMKWYNYKVQTEGTGTQIKTQTVQRSIEKAFGKNANRYVVNFVKDLNGVHDGGKGTDWFSRNMLSNYKVAAVGANLRVAVLQPTAYVRASAALDAKYLTQGLTAHPLKAAAEAEKYSGIATWKAMGFYDTNISRGVRDQIKHSETTKDKVVEKSMKAAEIADRMTFGTLWNACKIETREKTGFAGEELNEATAKRFRDVIYRTQVVDSTMTRSQTMRDTKGLSGLTTTFMAEPTLSYNMLLDAYSEYDNEIRRTDSKSKAWNKCKNTLTTAFVSYALTSLASSMAASLLDALRDDDDYENLLEKYAEAFSDNFLADLNPLNKLPVIKDVLSFFDGYDNSRMDTEWAKTLVDVYQIWSETVKLATGKLEKPTKITNYGNMTLYGKLYKSMKAISQLSGLPVSNASRDIAMIWNNTLGVLTDKKLKTYDPGKKANIKNAYQDGYLTADEAKAELVNEGIVGNDNDAFSMVKSWDTGGSVYADVYNAAFNGESIDKAVKELTSHGYTKDEVTSKLKSEIGKRYRDGQITKQEAMNMLKKYIRLDSSEITKEINKWSCKVVTGIAYEDIKQEYLAANISASRAAQMLVKYGGYTSEEAREKVSKYKDED